MDGRVLKLTNILFENLHRHWLIEEMAEIVELSSPHLRRLFKEETGISPIAYLKGLRLDFAFRLLETTHLRIKEIAFKVGMPDESHFTRDFKDYFGMSPTEYRKFSNESTLKKRGSNQSIDRFRQEIIGFAKR